MSLLATGLATSTDTSSYAVESLRVSRQGGGWGLGCWRGVGWPGGCGYGTPPLSAHRSGHKRQRRHRSTPTRWLGSSLQWHWRVSMGGDHT